LLAERLQRRNDVVVQDAGRVVPVLPGETLQRREIRVRTEEPGRQAAPERPALRLATRGVLRFVVLVAEDSARLPERSAHRVRVDAIVVQDAADVQEDEGDRAGHGPGPGADPLPRGCGT